MTRVGWVVLAIILAAAAAFASMLRIGGGTTITPPPERTPAAQLAPLAVPVAGVARSAIVDSWGDPRGGGTRAHHGIDLAAPSGTPVLAAAPGRIEKLFASVPGGITLYQRSADRRWIYYYAHLAGYAPGMHEGQAVRTGEPIGYVGDTGDAGPGNYHLHFGLARVAPEARWWEGDDVDPFPLLAGGPARR